PVTSAGANVADMTRLGEEARVTGSMPSPAWTAIVRTPFFWLLICTSSPGLERDLCQTCGKLAVGMGERCQNGIMILAGNFEVCRVPPGPPPGRHDAPALADELVRFPASDPGLEASPGRARPQQRAPYPCRALFEA